MSYEGQDQKLNYGGRSFFDHKGSQKEIDQLRKEGKKITVMEVVNTELFQHGTETTRHNVVTNIRSGLDQPPTYDPNRPPIDEWVPAPGDRLFTHIRGAIIVPIHRMFGMRDDDPANTMIDYFYVTAKRCYNSDTKMKDGKLSIGFRDHCTGYINFLEKFYDTEHILLNIYAQVKYMSDCQTRIYTLNAFIRDMCKLLINPKASYEASYLNMCIDRLVCDQFKLDLNYKNQKSPVLEYTNQHAKIMLKISFMQNIIIPMVCHFIMKKKIPADQVKAVLLQVFDPLFEISKETYGVDILSKLYETTISNVQKSVSSNIVLWEIQSIRSRNPSVQTRESVESLAVQILPKYSFSNNIIHFNFNAVNRDLRFKVLDISYEYSFTTLSSSVRDEDNNSECDKFEAHAAKLNEALLVQASATCRDNCKRIEQRYGPFPTPMLKFYQERLTIDGEFRISTLQRTLINYLMLGNACGGDTQTIKLVNIREYIIMMLAAKRILTAHRFMQLPYIIGGKVVRVVSRKSINKKEIQKIESSPYFDLIHKKYNNPKIEHDVILNLLAQILSSEYETISYENRELDGKPFKLIPDLVAEELLRYIMLL